MLRTIVSNGVTYNVSDAWAAVIDQGVPAPWPDQDTAEQQRLALLQASNSRTLTDAEYAAVEALTHIKNMHSAAAFLDGRTVEDVFGPDGTLDQVHGNAQHTDCGCVLHFIFDHHLRDQSPTQIPHTPKKTCKQHPVVDGDYVTHFNTVRAVQPNPATTRK